jgi:hypothetical protein
MKSKAAADEKGNARISQDLDHATVKTPRDGISTSFAQACSLPLRH